jgi:hypothetical protein
MFVMMGHAMLQKKNVVAKIKVVVLSLAFTLKGQKHDI